MRADAPKPKIIFLLEGDNEAVFLEEHLKENHMDLVGKVMKYSTKQNTAKGFSQSDVLRDFLHSDSPLLIKDEGGITNISPAVKGYIWQFAGNKTIFWFDSHDQPFQEHIADMNNRLLTVSCGSIKLSSSIVVTHIQFREQKFAVLDVRVVQRKNGETEEIIGRWKVLVFNTRFEDAIQAVNPGCEVEKLSGQKRRDAVLKYYRHDRSSDLRKRINELLDWAKKMD